MVTERASPNVHECLYCPVEFRGVRRNISTRPPLEGLTGVRSSWIFLSVTAVSVLLVAALGLPTRLSDDEDMPASMAAPAIARRLIPSLDSTLGPNIPPSVREAREILRATTPRVESTPGTQYRTPRGFKIIDPEGQYLEAGSRVRTTGAPRLPGPAARAAGAACPNPPPAVGAPPASPEAPKPPVSAPVETAITGSRPAILTEGAIYTTVVGSQEIRSMILATDPVTEQPVVTLVMTRIGARSLYAFSRDAVGETITLVLDGQVLVSPVLVSPVSVKAVIRGLDEESYARLLSQLVPLCP